MSRSDYWDPSEPSWVRVPRIRCCALAYLGPGHACPTPRQKWTGICPPIGARPQPHRRPPIKITRDLSTPENRAFWSMAERLKEVEKWPAWRLAGVTV